MSWLHCLVCRYELDDNDGQFELCRQERKKMVDGNKSSMVLVENCSKK